MVLFKPRVAVACALLAVTAVSAQAAVFPRSAPPGQCRTVHGRMALANGTFSFRIWAIGTTRILRVVDEEGDNFNDLDKLPKSLRTRLRPYADDPFRPRVFADFRVCAYTRSRPGVMQSVTLVGAKNIWIEAP
ncbi:MAG: hypothetical protein QM608_20530 [Caulobacter sp.]